MHDSNLNVEEEDMIDHIEPTEQELLNELAKYINENRFFDENKNKDEKQEYYIEDDSELLLELQKFTIQNNHEHDSFDTDSPIDNLNQMTINDLNENSNPDNNSNNEDKDENNNNNNNENENNQTDNQTLDLNHQRVDRYEYEIHNSHSNYKQNLDFNDGDKNNNQTPPSRSIQEMLQETNPSILQLFVNEFKLKSVLCKRNNDSDGMSRSFKIYKQLLAHLKTLQQTTSQVESLNDTLCNQLVLCKRIISYFIRFPKEDNGRELSKFKIFKDRIEQDLKIIQSFSLSLNHGNGKDENGNGNRENHYYTNKEQNTIETTQTSVYIPLVLDNSDVALDELVISISPSKVNINNCKDYFFQAKLEFPNNANLSPQSNGKVDQIKDSKFLSDSNVHVIKFSGLGRNIQTLKYFEYQKLKLHICKQSSFMIFGKKIVQFGHASIKLSPLLTQNTLSNSSCLFVDDNKKSIGNFGVTIKIAIPIKNANHNNLQSVKWTFISQSTLTREMNPTISLPKSSNSIPSPIQSIPSLEQGVNSKKFHSFNVIEYELELPNLSTKDENNLKATRDDLTNQVESGNLTMEQYLEDLENCTKETRLQALSHKRNGNMTLAKKCLIHLKIMTNELMEAREHYPSTPSTSNQ